MDTPDLVGWDINEQNKRTIFMQHMYERSGRTSGVFTGLWQEFCLKEAGISIEEVDYITISRDPSANLQKKILHTIKKGVSLNTLVSRFTNSRKGLTASSRNIIK